MPLSKQEQFFVHEFSEEEVSIATTERSSFSARGLSRVANLVEVEEEDSTVAVAENENEPAGNSNTSLGDRGSGLRRSQERGLTEVVEGLSKNVESEKTHFHVKHNT